MSAITNNVIRNTITYNVTLAYVTCYRHSFTVWRWTDGRARAYMRLSVGLYIYIISLHSSKTDHQIKHTQIELCSLNLHIKIHILVLSSSFNYLNLNYI